MRLVLSLLLLMLALPAFAQDADLSEEEKFWNDVMSQAIYGPDTVTVNAVGEFELPEGMIYLPKKAAVAFSEYMGNPAGDSLEGIIFSEDEDWAGYVEYYAEGYISDDDAKEMDADAILKIYEDGNKEANKERVKMGTAEIEIAGWAAKPQYNAEQHILVWAMNIKEKGVETAAEDLIINYNTYVLGRSGYFDMTFVTDASVFEAQKPIADNIISNIKFVSGEDYASFDPEKDKDSGLGLTALIAGGGAVVAKKVGLIAVIAKFGKVIIAGVIGVAAVIFKRKQKKKNSMYSE
ncbi:MAG: DUF2167 domain-containing protein [Deferribacteraceae bacterium]|jgi:uncharacterized membrane-anchored protein|nr:DUF2167 domain-containing protein [Deferribacteraceae bacterium]